MTRKIILTIILLAAVFPLHAQLVPPEQVPENRRAFTFGEKLTYTVKYSLYLNINVGEVTFEVRDQPRQINGRDCYHLVSLGRTYNFYDRFFKVRDRFESFVDQQSLQPQLFIRNVHEGNFKFQEQVYFNHSNLTARSLKRTQDIPKNTQDILSALYYARNIDYSKASPGDSFMIHTFLDDTTFFVGVKFVGREEIRTSAGRFNTIIVRPLLVVDRVFKSEEDMTIWVTDDLNRMPVRIKSGISVGSIVADLNSFEGLKHPLSSRKR